MEQCEAMKGMAMRQFVFGVIVGLGLSGAAPLQEMGAEQSAGDAERKA